MLMRMSWQSPLWMIAAGMKHYESRRGGVVRREKSWQDV